MEDDLDTILAVARAAARLGARLANEAPDGRPFVPVEETVRDDAQGRIALLLAPLPSEPAGGRYVQLRLWTPSGGSVTSRWLLRGALAELRAFLADAGTPPAIVATLHELALHQRRQDLP